MCALVRLIPAALLGVALGAAPAAEAPAVPSQREGKAGPSDPGKGAPAVKLDLAAYERIRAEKFSWGWIRWLMNDKIDPKAGLTMGLVYLEPNKSNPLHVHPNAEEVLHVLSGSCEHRVGLRSVKLRAGDTLRIPQGTPHQARTGNEPCLVLVIYNTGNRQMVLVPEDKPKR
jgi:quercetin dioxygenase-like cupin family protein